MGGVVGERKMKCFGVDRKDRWCCPGHDKFPKEKYNNRRSVKAHRVATKIAHRRGRARLKVLLIKELKGNE